MARTPRPAGQASPLLVAAAVLILVVAVVLLRPLASREGLPFLVVAVVVVGLLFGGMYLVQRRQRRHLDGLRARYPVSFLIREPVPVRENSWISADRDHVRFWRLDDGALVPVMELSRADTSFEKVEIQLTPVKRGTGVEVSGGSGESVQFSVLRDRSGVLPRRLTGSDLDQAVQALRTGASGSA